MAIFAFTNIHACQMTRLMRVCADLSAMGPFVEQLGELMDTIQMMMGQTDADREENNKKFNALAIAMERMAQSNTANANSELLGRVALGQEALIQKLDDNGMDGIDAESRMRLRSIDVQLLRILEEMSAGRQESVGDLRSEIANLTNAIKGRG